MHKHNNAEVVLCLGEDGLDLEYSGEGGKDGPDLALSVICLLGKDPDGLSEGVHAGITSGQSTIGEFTEF